jgi:hypothetical protein
MVDKFAGSEDSEDGDGGSDLLRAGDVVLGVSGFCTIGLDVAGVEKVIAAVRRAMTSSASWSAFSTSSAGASGLIVLHLSDFGIDQSLVEEASNQMITASTQLLQGSKSLVDAAASAAKAALGRTGGTNGGAAAMSTD